nr:proton-conducting transporter membrane subunit [Angustibacter aerolatus]
MPQGFSAVAPVLGALGAAGVLWGGLVCLRERDLKRLVAYSSVAHTGFVALGIASGTPEGLQGALFLNVAHGAISALLFVVAGALKDSGRTGVGDVGAGLRDRAPRLGAMLAVGCVAGLGLPGLAGFWGEPARGAGQAARPGRRRARRRARGGVLAGARGAGRRRHRARRRLPAAGAAPGVARRAAGRRTRAAGGRRTRGRLGGRRRRAPARGRDRRARAAAVAAAPGHRARGARGARGRAGVV